MRSLRDILCDYNRTLSSRYPRMLFEACRRLVQGSEQDEQALQKYEQTRNSISTKIENQDRPDCWLRYENTTCYNVRLGYENTACYNVRLDDQCEAGTIFLENETIVRTALEAMRTTFHAANDASWNSARELSAGDYQGMSHR